MINSKRAQILALLGITIIGMGFGAWLVRCGYFGLGLFWIVICLWRAQQAAVWFISPHKAPSNFAPPLTSRWQRVLQSILGLLGAAICALGVYLWHWWPEEWQAGLVFVLFGLIVLVPLTIKGIQSRRGLV